MVKIKIIDLLNKKATNEIMPNKIKYFLNELDFQIIVYDEEAGEYVYEKCPNEIWTPSWHHINDEVEILEVEKDNEIEKLDITQMLQKKKWKRDKKSWEKINEIIDEVNKLRTKDER